MLKKITKTPAGPEDSTIQRAIKEGTAYIDLAELYSLLTRKMRRRPLAGQLTGKEFKNKVFIPTASPDDVKLFQFPFVKIEDQSGVYRAVFKEYRTGRNPMPRFISNSPTVRIFFSFFIFFIRFIQSLVYSGILSVLQKSHRSG